ncbi:glycosyltransferase family 4 protein [Dongia soli]|uniref:Glycosyltransferase family 4 protein n=1 Tax=Dongia soli TaxID=600628 RepID=A0ABU5ED02_9PROT|nr:glycosyltransferase family 4 protein [Dongia soli]MDY0884245.1 glycosyltransferase family 4 protein [Dongia soli]
MTMAGEFTVYVISPGGTQARGGMGRMVRYFVNEIRRREGAPDIVVVDTYGPGSKFLMPVFFLLALLRLSAACMAGKADILHAHVSERGSVLRKFILCLPALLLGIPVIMHMHGAEFVQFYKKLPAPLKNLVCGFLRKCDSVVVLGSAWQEYVVNELKLDPSQIVILHNAVPAPLVGRRAEEPESRECRLAFVGEVGERKGIPELIEALAQPRFQVASWSLRIAGNGAVRHFQAVAEKKDLKSPRVNFLGWTDEHITRQLLADSDILILPSHNEGLPMAILEALSYGLAVITTPVGSILDAIDDRQNGLIVPPKNAEKLSDAIFELINDSELRRRLGCSAREKFERHFEIGPYCDRLISLYGEHMTGRVKALGRQ